MPPKSSTSGKAVEPASKKKRFMSKATAIEISAEEFDRRFDEGEDMTPYLDMSTARRPGLDAKRVNVDVPSWMVQTIDL